MRDCYIWWDGGNGSRRLRIMCMLGDHGDERIDRLFLRIDGFSS